MSKNEEAVCVVLADDHPIILSGITGLLKTDPCFSVAAACCDGEAALRSIREVRPEIAVLDVSMPGLTGIEVLAALVSEEIGTRVVFLTASVSDEHIVAAVAQGAWGLMLKDAAADMLLECLHAVANGERWLPPDLIDPALEREAGRRLKADQIANVLTLRERELALWVSAGLSNKHIARRANVSEGTVKIHLHNIYQKLGVANRTSLAAFALTHRELLARADLPTNNK